VSPQAADLQFSGVVEEVGVALPHDSQPAEPGSQDAPLKIGDRVMGVSRFGAFADKLNAQVRPLPPSLPSFLPISLQSSTCDMHHA